MTAAGCSPQVISRSTSAPGPRPGGERVLDLGPLELDLLTFLLRNRGIIVSRTTIADNVWRDRRPPASESAVAVLVLRVRHKLEAGGEPRRLQTVRG
jgi:two-component system, OmpR family, response regulator MprA